MSWYVEEVLGLKHGVASPRLGKAVYPACNRDTGHSTGILINTCYNWHSRYPILSYIIPRMPLFTPDHPMFIWTSHPTPTPHVTHPWGSAKDKLILTPTHGPPRWTHLAECVCVCVCLPVSLTCIQALSQSKHSTLYNKMWVLIVYIRQGFSGWLATSSIPQDVNYIPDYPQSQTGCIDTSTAPCCMQLPAQCTLVQCQLHADSVGNTIKCFFLQNWMLTRELQLALYPANMVKRCYAVSRLFHYVTVFLVAVSYNSTCLEWKLSQSAKVCLHYPKHTLQLHNGTQCVYCGPKRLYIRPDRD